MRGCEDQVRGCEGQVRARRATISPDHHPAHHDVRLVHAHAHASESEHVKMRQDRCSRAHVPLASTSPTHIQVFSAFFLTKRITPSSASHRRGSSAASSSKKKKTLALLRTSELSLWRVHRARHLCTRIGVVRVASAVAPRTANLRPSFFSFPDGTPTGFAESAERNAEQVQRRIARPPLRRRIQLCARRS